MTIWKLILAGLVLAPLPAWADGAEAVSSVLVTTVPAKQGTLPEILSAYGAAEPAPDGATSISLLRGGQIASLHVTPGETVRKNDPLLEFGADPATIATYEQAVSALAAAQRDRTQTSELLQQQLATRAQLAHADKAVADAQTALDALNRAGGGKPVETIRAPFDGVVTSIAVGPGDRIQPSAPLLQLARADRLVVAVGVEPSDRAKVAAGAPVRFAPLADKGAPIDGTVASVSGMIDPKTRLVEALIRPAAESAVLPGAQYRADIEIGRFTGWLVPREALLLDETGARLFQVADGKAVGVPVTILGQSGDMTAVDGALDPSRPIVVVGSYQLTDGAAVRLEDEKSDKTGGQP